MPGICLQASGLQVLDGSWMCFQSVVSPPKKKTNHKVGFSGAPIDWWVPPTSHVLVTRSLFLMGLRSVSRMAIPAYWASWGDALKMIAQRHRVMAATLVHELAGRTRSAHLSAAVHPVDQLAGLDGFESWQTSRVAHDHF